MRDVGNVQQKATNGGVGTEDFGQKALKSQRFGAKKGILGPNPPILGPFRPGSAEPQRWAPPS